MDDDVDLLERARACDREAWRALLHLWGNPALKLAAAIAGDRARALHAVRGAFIELWPELPAVHTEHAFRPWLLGSVALRAMGDEPDDARAAAIMHKAMGMGPAEVALALHLNLGKAARILRKPPDAPDLPAVELPVTFFDEAIAPALEDAVVLTVRRALGTDASSAWAAFTDPDVMRAWAGTDARVRPAATLQAGSRIIGKGTLAGKRRTRDEWTVTRAERERVLAWTVRARIGPVPAPLESRWSLTLEPGPDLEVALRLHGVAFPGGASGAALRRSYSKVADGMQPWAGRRLEELAGLVDVRARRPAL